MVKQPPPGPLVLTQPSSNKYQKQARKMKSNIVVKCFVLLTVCVFLLICYTTFTNEEFHKKVHSSETTHVTEPSELKIVFVPKPKREMYYILQWTSPLTVPFVYMGTGQQVFLEKNCPYSNCYVTSDRRLLGDYSNFDAIVFAATELAYLPNLPHERSPHQKFVFASIESADNYPVCSDRYDGFFNWTWTYRLDSDSKWGYVAIRDNNGFLVGPKEDMNWKEWEDMLPTPDSLKIVLQRKKKLVAWFVSNCHTKSKREEYAYRLKVELEKNHNATIDIYGLCGTHICTRENESICDDLIRKEYMFYLAFENALSEDYVTEKLIHAVGYNAIPIVYGGADYSRFLPPYSYLDATKLTAKELAYKIIQLTENFETYANYFRWTRYYSYHKRSHSAETDDYCGFCILMNDEEKRKEISVYEDFRSWWDPPNTCQPIAAYAEM